MCVCGWVGARHVTRSQYIIQITNGVAKIITLVFMFFMGTIIKFIKWLGLLNLLIH